MKEFPFVYFSEKNNTVWIDDKIVYTFAQQLTINSIFIMKRFFSFIIAIIFSVAIISCGGSSESTSDKVEDAMDDAGDAVEEAADDVQDAAEDAGEDIEDAVEEAADSVENDM